MVSMGKRGVGVSKGRPNGRRVAALGVGHKVRVGRSDGPPPPVDRRISGGGSPVNAHHGGGGHAGAATPADGRASRVFIDDPSPPVVAYLYFTTIPAYRVFVLNRPSGNPYPIARRVPIRGIDFRGRFRFREPGFVPRFWLRYRAHAAPVRLRPACTWN